MAFPRPLILVAAVAAGVLSSASTAALAAPSAPRQGPGQVNVAQQAANRAWQAFEARAAARAHPHAVPATAAQQSTATTATTAATTATASQSGTITNVESISRDTLPSLSTEIEPDTETEPAVAIDPGNPRIMTAVVQEGRNAPFGGTADLGYATSHDGGRTWTDGNYPSLTTVVGGPFQLASDAVSAFGPDGSDYIESIAVDETDARSAVTVQRSTDGGIKFGAPSLVTDDNNVNVFNDKDWITVDTSRRSPFEGRIYVMWARFITTGTGASAVTHSPGALSFSDDHGKTWSPIHFMTPQSDDDQGFLPLIHKDGSVTIVYDHFVPNPGNPNLGNDYETAQTSHDGGLTWSKPVTIGQFLGSEVPGMRTGGLPAAAIDPVTGNMYAVWQDTRFNPAGLNDIVLSVSKDGGARWSAPRAVSPEAPGLDRFTPAVAADAGVVHITYGTRADSGAAPTASEDYIASADGGKTFGNDRQVGPPIVLQWATVSDEAPPPVAFLGDYLGLAATPSSAEMVWSVASQPPAGELYHQTMWGATITR
jgi:Neuraminidase (sialidase)